MGVKEDISMLESKVARLKVEYEQYFMRVIKREPVKLRGEVDQLILKYTSKPISNTADKFKFNSIVAKYNSYKQYWGRILRAIEDGTYVRRAEGGSGRAPATPSTPAPSAGSPAGAGRAKKSGAAGGSLDDICDRFIEARRQCKEPTKGLTKEAVARTISRNIDQVARKYKTKDVDVNVRIENGHAKLTIKPKKSA